MRCETKIFRSGLVVPPWPKSKQYEASGSRAFYWPVPATSPAVVTCPSTESRDVLWLTLMMVHRNQGGRQYRLTCGGFRAAYLGRIPAASRPAATSRTHSTSGASARSAPTAHTANQDPRLKATPEATEPSTPPTKYVAV